MLQRAAGWCKAVSGCPLGKILSELSGLEWAASAPQLSGKRQAPVIYGPTHCWMRTEGPGFAPAIRVVPQRIYAFVSYEP